MKEKMLTDGTTLKVELVDGRNLKLKEIFKSFIKFKSNAKCLYNLERNSVF